MSDNKVALPYVYEPGIMTVSNPGNFPKQVVCEAPPIIEYDDVEGEIKESVPNDDGTFRVVTRKVTKKVPRERRDVQEVGIVAPYSHEAFKAEISDDGKCVWRQLK